MQNKTFHKIKKFFKLCLILQDFLILNKCLALFYYFSSGNLSEYGLSGDRLSGLMKSVNNGFTDRPNKEAPNNWNAFTDTN
jgi:hypothetical protein